MTLKQLLIHIKKAVDKDKSILDKEVLISDDDEGNGYHGMYYAPTCDAKTVRECIEFSNGATVDIDDYSKFIILG